MLKIQILHLEFDFVALMSVGRLAALTLSQLFSSPHSLYVTQCPHWNLKSVSNLSSWNSVPNSFEKPPWSYIGLGGKSFHRSKMGCLSFGAFEVSVELSLGKKRVINNFSALLSLQILNLCEIGFFSEVGPIAQCFSENVELGNLPPTLILELLSSASSSLYKQEKLLCSANTVQFVFQ